MADRTEYLAYLRSRTKGNSGEYHPTRAPGVPWTPDADRADAEPPIADLPARFLEELEAVGGHGAHVATLTQAREYVLDLARAKEAKLLVRWDAPTLRHLGADAKLREGGTEVVVWRNLEDFRDVAGRADIGLTTAEWAVAETGSIIVTAAPGQGRTATLLPPVHVAVLAAERVVGTVEEAIEKYAAAGEAIPSNLAFHTGPSRSGDIEQSLTIGVHGPGEVHVVLVGE
jgi:L-lactate dehydrogenase complex protein LldG